MNDFTESWTRWREARLRAVSAPHGLASLVGTHWLGAEPLEAPGIDVAWQRDGDDIVGGDGTRLGPGEELARGPLLLRHLSRGGEVALRVFDEEAPGRASLTGISVFEPDERWVLTGRFTPAADGASLPVESIDGSVDEVAVAGTVEVEIEGERVRLTVTGDGERLRAVFSDTTSGDETYRFRFLTLPTPAASGAVVVDLNRAFLPPCAFAEHYLCPLPPPGNRLSVAVRAGEKLPEWVA